MTQESGVTPHDRRDHARGAGGRRRHGPGGRGRGQAGRPGQAGGAGHDPGRRRPGQRRLHPQEARGVRGHGHPLGPPAAGRRRVPGRDPGGGGGVQRRPGGRRLPDPEPVPGRPGLQRRHRRHGPGQGRRRPPPDQPRACSPSASPTRPWPARRPASWPCWPTTRCRSPGATWSSWAGGRRSGGRCRCCSPRSARAPTPRSPWSTPACPTGPTTPAGPTSSWAGRAFRT